MSLAGNLRDRSISDLLRSAQRERRTGILRLRQNGPDGAQRGDLILRDGGVVGAALSRSGGVHGMGDALVEAALAGPEDALAAMQRAAGSLSQAKGALAEGAKRVGVSLELVEQTLRQHIVALVAAMRDWHSGTFELLQENFPAGGLDRDSASARAFLLDGGLSAAAALGEPEPEAVTAVSEPMELPATEVPQVRGPGGASEARLPPGEGAAPGRPGPGDRERPSGGLGDAVPQVSTDWFDDAAPEAAFEVPDAEPLSPEPEPAPAPKAPIFAAPPDSSAPPSADAEDADIDADDADDAGPDDGSAAGVDLSAPGFGEAALMEAETLLDSEVLSVMLEMGNSAAQTAAESVEISTATVRTGHLLLIDEDGVLTSHLVLPLREAGYVVHAAQGRAAGLEKLSTAASAGERPLVVCDLLLSREGGGMLGGLDLATHAATLDPAPPVVLLAETSGDEVRAKAEEAKVSVLLPRPLKSELKKDDAARAAFLVELLHAVDQHRPHPEWRVGQPAAWETGEARNHEGGWDLQEIETRAAEAEDPPEFAVADPGARREALWRETMRELSAPLSPQEIMLQILRFGAEVLHRGVLFTPAGKAEIKGFGQFGVELAPEVDPDEAVRQIRFPYGEHPGVQRALEERVAVRWTPTGSPWEEHLSRALGGRTPPEVFLGPVYCQGRIAGFFYGDMLPTHEQIPDTTNLEVVLGQAGLALDRHLLETRIKALESTDPNSRRGGG